MACVTECEDGEVHIKDPQLRNLDLCRGLDYYVDPEGTAIIELGTKKYPYKNIELPFVEILNIHSHTERNINLYLKENTTSYIMQSRNYIINVTSVNIDTYTDGTKSPEYTNILATDSEIELFSPVTVMNLLLNDTLNLYQQANLFDISENEATQLGTTDVNIHLDRSSLSMNRINVSRDLKSNKDKATNFIQAIYLQEHTLTMTNMNIQLTGFILDTVDPMNLHVENVHIDFHAMMGGFVMRTKCNYPEAYLQGNITFDNVSEFIIR